MDGLMGGLPSVAPAWCTFLVILAVWEVAWKGIALWRAGGNHHLWWFICMFIFNTAGILPIVYIFAFSRKKEG